MTDNVIYTLPLPPSVNGLFVQLSDRRVKTLAYKRWRSDAGWMILEQGRKRITGKVYILIESTRPDKRVRDASNLIKAVEDLLVETGVIEDDSLVEDVRSRWVSQGPSCRVLVQPCLDGGVSLIDRPD